MTETKGEFLDRTYSDIKEDKVYVYPSKEALQGPPNKLVKPEEWTRKQVRDYLEYLEEDLEV